MCNRGFSNILELGLFRHKFELAAEAMTNVVQSDGIDIIQTFANFLEMKDKEGYIDSPMKEEHLQEIAGRASQGASEADFEYLQKFWTEKRLAWVMGGDGLVLFLKHSNVQALRAIGLEDRWMRKKLEMGGRFRLGIFYQSDQCVLGTWDGVLSMIDRFYSKSISTKILQHADALKQMSFKEIEARAKLSYLRDVSYFAVNELPADGVLDDPRFMTEKRLSECEGTLEECRGFLYNRINLTELFDGSGFTKDASGQLHVREYLQLNVPVRDIPGFRYLDLPIDSNDLIPDA